MQRGHDHFQRRLLLELRVRVDGDAAAIVGDAQEAVVLEAHLDAARVTGDRLVHGVVEHLGEEVMQRLLVGAADIHARPPAHRLEPLEHLDVGRGIGVVGRSPAVPLRLGWLGGGDRLLLQLVFEFGEEVA